MKGNCKMAKGTHKMPSGKMMKDNAMIMMMAKEKPKAKAKAKAKKMY